MRKTLIIFVLALISNHCLQAQEQQWTPSTYYTQRVSLFKSLPTQKGAIIFLGNSLTDGGEWAEMLRLKTPVLNRGISGDTSEGVLMRINEVVRHRPRIVFLLIGTNDLSRNISGEKVVENILKIAEIIRTESPSTRFYVQSILPVNDQFGMFKTHTNKGEIIREINRSLSEKADANKFTFIDLHTLFCNEDGKLKAEYTNDGLHLLAGAYAVWKKAIIPYLKGLK